MTTIYFNNSKDFYNAVNNGVVKGYFSKSDSALTGDSQMNQEKGDDVPFTYWEDFEISKSSIKVVKEDNFELWIEN